MSTCQHRAARRVNTARNALLDYAENVAVVSNGEAARVIGYANARHPEQPCPACEIRAAVDRVDAMFAHRRPPEPPSDPPRINRA